MTEIQQQQQQKKNRSRNLIKSKRLQRYIKVEGNYEKQRKQVWKLITTANCTKISDAEKQFKKTISKYKALFFGLQLMKEI